MQGGKYIDKSHKTMRTDDKAEEQIASPAIVVTFAPTIHKKTWSVKEKTEKVSQEENKIENMAKEKNGNVYKEKKTWTLSLPKTYVQIYVFHHPCRLVTEHPCCRFPQRI